MATSKNLAKCIALVGSLKDTELIELRSKIDERLVHLSEHNAESNIDAGHIEYKFIKKANGKRYGPYKHLRVWKDNKLTDQYLGKASQEEYVRWLSEKDTD